MKKSNVVLIGVFFIFGIVSFPEIRVLDMQSLISGICLGAAVAMLAAGLRCQTDPSNPSQED